MNEIKQNESQNIGFWFLLVAAAFILGHLITKSQYLQNQKSAPVLAAVIPTSVPSVVLTPPPAAVNPSADNVPKITSADHLRGSASAQITLIEYSDLECPYCKKFHPTMQQVLKDYSGKVNWVYRHFPLPFHANANPAALAGECVNEQAGNNGFWQFVDGIFADPNPLNSQAITSVSGQIALDKSQFESCVAEKKYQKVVDEQLAGGQKAGINGTPGTVLINNKTGKTQLISGALPIEEIKKAIDAALVELP